MQTQLVSILIPVFNAEKTIERCIKSCINQTHQNIEIIIINDASTDESEQLILKFHGSRIVYLKNSSNLGIANTRNLLLKKAKGNYIAWLDADDFMAMNRVETQLKFLIKNPSVDICGSYIYLVDGFKTTKAKTFIKPEEIKSVLWFKNCMFQPSIMAKNFFVEENIFYNLDFDYVEDFELWGRLRTIKQFANIPECLTYYQNPENIVEKHKNYDFKLKLKAIINSKFHSLEIQHYKHSLNSWIKLMYNNSSLNSEDVLLLKNLFAQIAANNTEPFFKFMLSYLKLRVFIKISIKDKVKNFNLLFTSLHPMVFVRFVFKRF